MEQRIDQKFIDEAVRAAQSPEFQQPQEMQSIPISPEVQILMTGLQTLSNQLDLLIQLECGWLSKEDMKQKFKDFEEKQKIRAAAEKLGVRPPE